MHLAGLRSEYKSFQMRFFFGCLVFAGFSLGSIFASSSDKDCKKRLRAIYGSKLLSSAEELGIEVPDIGKEISVVDWAHDFISQKAAVIKMRGHLYNQVKAKEFELARWKGTREKSWEETRILELLNQNRISAEVVRNLRDKHIYVFVKDELQANLVEENVFSVLIAQTVPASQGENMSYRDFLAAYSSVKTLGYELTLIVDSNKDK